MLPVEDPARVNAGTDGAGTILSALRGEGKWWRAKFLREDYRCSHIGRKQWCQPRLSPHFPGKPPYNVSLSDLIKQGTDNACANSNTITDLKLRRCIQKSCNQGTIKCDCASKASSEGGFNSKFPGITNRTAHQCTESWPNYTDPSYAATWYGQTSIHEWAHGCGWNHGDGGGVPNDPGRGH